MSSSDAPESPKSPLVRGHLGRWSAIAGIVLVLVIGGWTLYWQAAAARLAQGVDAWFAARRAAGWEAHQRGIEVTGFPFRLLVDITAPVLGEPGRWRWQGPAEIQGWAYPFALDRWHLTAPGWHRLVVKGHAWTLNLPLTIKDLTATLSVPGGRFRRARLHAGNVRATLGDGNTVALGGVDLRVTALDAKPLPKDAGSDARPPAVLRLALALTHLKLPPGTLKPFGDDIPTASLDATLRAPLGGEGTLADELVAWRDNGGVLDVSHISGQLKPVSVSADGTVALDQALQPLAAFSVRARGASDAVDRFVKAGKMDQGAGLAAKLALGVLGGADGEIKTAVTVQDRTLYLGKLAVTRVPRVTW